MSISFNEVPSGSRVPFCFVEFDNTGAIKGSQNQPYKAVMFGQRLSAGTVKAGVITLVTSKEQAQGYFGLGSHLAIMCEFWFKSNKKTPLYCVAFDDASTGTAGSGKITISASPTENGTVYIMIDGKSINVGVSSGEAIASIASDIATKINAASELPVSAVAAAGAVTLTTKNKGLTAGKVDVRLNYYSSTQSTPGGLGIAITDITGGATNPDLTTAIALMDGEQYNIVINPFTDSTNIALIKAELESRWTASVMKEGFAFMAYNDTVANLTTFGNGLNTPVLTTLGLLGSPNSASAISAAYAANVAYYGNIDPARPFQTLTLTGILAPSLDKRFSWSEKETLLASGIATAMIDSGDNVCIERAITMYQKNSLGANDTSYLDINTVLTLSYLRWDFRNMILTKYPRHKLANDGTKFGAGQAIVTPSVVKAECISRFRMWEEAGLVEDADSFKAGLMVERNASDVNRLDILLDPDLVNQLIVTAAKIKFVL